MKKTKKIVALALAAVLLVCTSVAATLAYLQDSTQVVNNTFTVGKVLIDLDEAEVDEYGENANGRTETGNEYKLVPGHTYIKDPTVYVKAGSEECYLFVEVVNGLVDIIDEKTIEDQMDEKGWVNLEGNIWYLDTTVDASESTTDISKVVFENFKLKGDADVADYATATITIKAFAVQADGMTDAADAWTKAGF